MLTLNFNVQTIQPTSSTLSTNSAILVYSVMADKQKTYKEQLIMIVVTGGVKNKINYIMSLRWQ